MGIRTSIIMAGVTLALVAPVTAGAALTKTGTPADISQARSNAIAAAELGPQPAAKNAVVHRTKVTTVTHKSSAISTGASATPVAPKAVYIDAPAVAPIVQTQAQICQTSGNGCTAEQYCEFWSINCSALANGGDESTADASSLDGQTSDASATATDSADVLAQDADALANLEQEYCCTADECMSDITP